MAEWIPVATRAELEESNGKVVTQDTTTLAVFKVGDEVYAIQNECPHMLASLAEGSLDGVAVVCPWHKGKFCLRTGSSIGAQNYGSARVYQVKWEGDDVLLMWPPGQSKLVIK